MTGMRSITGLTALFLIGQLIAGCATQSPAPVVDRSVTGTPLLHATAAKPEERVPTYTVKRGETLYSIAAENRVDHRDLAAWNGITDPTRVQPGVVLRLRPPVASEAPAGVQVMPVAGSGAVESRPLGSAGGEPLRTETARAASSGSPSVSVSPPLKSEPKAVKLPYSEENLAALQRGESPRPGATKPEIRAETAPASAARPAVEANDTDRVDWSWPVAGRVLAGFSEARKGIDIAARNGEPVHASAGGRVVYSGSGLRGYGKLVIIKHNEKYLSAYGYNRRLFVKEGETVAKGQKIGEVGLADTGASRLHFEIRQLGKPVDPQKFLPER